MNVAFPDAEVNGFAGLISSFSNLPDPNDAHVIATAVRSRADVIVTTNIRDFPSEVLAPYDLEAQDPDIFLTHIVDLDGEGVLKALNRQIARLNNPPINLSGLLQILHAAGLRRFAEKVKSIQAD